MAFLDKTGLQTVTNKLVQGDAIKVASHRGRTVENVIDNITRECTNVPTPLEYKIENRVNEFKVGQGRDVDASGDVEKGYSEIELQGKTWQNLHPSLSRDNCRRVEGQVEFYENKIKLVASGNWTGATFDLPLIKRNTTYSLIINVTKNTLSSKDHQVLMGFHGAVGNMFTGVGLKVFKIISHDKDSTSYLAIKLQNTVESGEFEYSAILLEGDHTQTPIEELPQYFEGIQSSFEDGVVDIEAVGKNIIDFNFDDLIKTNPSLMSITEQERELCLKINYLHSTFDLPSPFKVTEGEYYRLSFVAKSDVPVTIYVGFDDKNNGSPWYSGVLAFRSIASIGTSFRQFTKIVKCSRSTIINKCGIVSYSDGNTIIKPNSFMLEKVSVDTKEPIVYEPCYKNNFSFDIGEPLRSLPNGTSDEIRCSNGQWELVRRVSKVTLKGNEAWTQKTGNWLGDKTIGFYTRIGEMIVELMEINVLSNRFSSKIYSDMINSGVNFDTEGICNDNGVLAIRISKSKLVSQDSIGFKAWLQSNPTTVYYELETPIITPIDPIKFETQPLGSIEINSEIPPTSFHTVQLNRAAQIERGITEIAELKNRVEILETIYDSYFLETAHKLELLGMDYELESEVI